MSKTQDAAPDFKQRISVRDARKEISNILGSATTARVGPQYGELRGFVVGVPKHDHWNADQKKKALKAAKAAFTAAWIAETEQ